MYGDPHQLSGSRSARAEAQHARARTTDALYVISVAARLVELHPTTLRKYERVGFLEPSRTPGRTRLYSHEDIRRLRQIKRLVEEREMNLAGVQMALDLTTLLREIVSQIDRAPDIHSLRRRVETPLREAFATLGALEESR
jgi:MerR family transcriptional regulator/heat shock protein HspR